jgi:hypothetical protein
MYAVLDKNNKIRNLFYFELNQTIIDHHAQYNEIVFEVSQNEKYIIESFYANEQNNTDEQYTPDFELIKKAYLLNVNLQANKLILAIAPEHKQRNLTARSTELQERRLDGEDLTDDELQEVAAIKSIWVQIKLIREQSNVITDNIIACTTQEELDQVNITLE